MSPIGSPHAALLTGGAVIDVDGSLFLQLGIFFALFFILRHYVFRPMMAVFDAREAAIDGARRDAKSIEAEAETKLKAFEAEMKKVRAEAGSERDQIRQDAGKLERELLADARKQADATLGDASKAMEEQAAKIRAEMKTTVPALASQIAEKLLGRKAA